MKTSYMAALLLASANLAMAEKLTYKYACCELGSPIDNAVSANGMLLFSQQQSDGAQLKAYGALTSADILDAHRYLAVTDGAAAEANTCNDVKAKPENFLHKVYFDGDGTAEYEHAGTEISLNLSLGKSVSMYQDEQRDGMVEACCVITELADLDAFCVAAANLGL